MRNIKFGSNILGEDNIKMELGYEGFTGANCTLRCD
jgi:hypothetical protein